MVYYFIASHKSTVDLITKGNLAEIDNYINNPITRYPIQGKVDNWVDGAYQIASRAIEMNRADVLKHIKRQICFDYIPDGNAYELFVLATESHNFNLIPLLWEIANENGYQEVAQLSYALKLLVRDKDLSEDEIIDKLPIYLELVELDLKDAYSSAKRWGLLKIAKYFERFVMGKLLGFELTADHEIDWYHIKGKYGGISIDR